MLDLKNYLGAHGVGVKTTRLEEATKVDALAAEGSAQATEVGTLSSSSSQKRSLHLHIRMYQAADC
jgi:hypothetical protein